MKKILLLAALLTLLAGCRDAYVSLTNDDQEILIDQAGGYTTPERMNNIKRSQEETTTLQELEKQQRLAIKRHDLIAADSLQDLIDRKKFRVGGFGAAYPSAGQMGAYPAKAIASNGKSVKLAMANPTKDAVVILNGPFAGTVLNPGESTAQARLWPVGVFQLEYEVYPVGRSWSFKKRVNISLPESRTSPITFY